ncbi:MAG: type II toxin-antitoxin system VapC family toxin [Gammaproteobacteria bacterium]|nr:type II toxin-antitoxin system VapC family toxin [Gammaproteobacteria bacterium]MYB37271.1 type II toxin-antitoxin system VapC family toxin [Gammaproteobacteria bacterium]
MIVVVDASVALKWFLKWRPEEADADAAVAILEAVGDGRLEMLQPPHFIAEVAAVLTRVNPDGALQDLDDLGQVDWTVAESSTIYAPAATLAIRLQHHLFDTLYHATSLSTPGAMLITADDAYFDKAAPEGRVVRLADFTLPTD